MPDTHTHTIESGNARVSVEADDAARAVSEAGRNWEMNNMGETIDEIATLIADAIFHARLGSAHASMVKVIAETLRPLIQRAEAAERAIEKLPMTRDGVRVVPGMLVFHRSVESDPQRVAFAFAPGCVGQTAPICLNDGEYRRAGDCYSTREAALAAGDGGNGK